MEVSVDTNNPNYDTSHGEQIAVNVDGGKNRPPNERFFQRWVLLLNNLHSY